MLLRSNNLIAVLIVFIVIVYSIVLAVPWLSVATKSVTLMFLYLTPIVFLVINRFITFKLNSSTLLIWFLVLFLTLKDLSLYLTGIADIEVFYYSLLRFFICVSLYLVVCNVSFELEKRVFSLFFIGALTIFSLTFFIDVDLSGNVILIMGLLSIVSTGRWYKAIVLSLVFAIISFFLESRTGLLVIIFYMLHRFFLYIPSYKRYWENIILYFLILFVLMQLMISLEYADDLYLNVLFTKRPFIWGAYITEVMSNSFSQLFGFGKITGHFAEQVGVIVADEFGVGRKYSAHSFYINFIYEHGLLGFSLFCLFIFKMFINTSYTEEETKTSEYLLFTLIAALVIPMYIGGNSIFDMILTYTLFRKAILNEKNSANS